MTEQSEYIAIALLIISGIFFVIGIASTVTGMGNRTALGGKQFLFGIMSLGICFLFLIQSYLANPKLMESVFPVMEQTVDAIQENPFSDGTQAESAESSTFEQNHGTIKEILLFSVLMITGGYFLAPIFSRGMILSLFVVSAIISIYLLRKNADVTYATYSLYMAGFVLGFLFRRK